MPIFVLDSEKCWFPNGKMAEKDGLLAIGGDLRTERLLNAYSNGIFPWYNPGDRILWWCPHERFVIFPEKINISRSMKKFLKKNIFTVTFNEDFSEIIHRCRKKREYKEGTWITDEMEEAYNKLFEQGYAFSAEVRYEGKIVGGLYGVQLGKCLFGESMFSDMANASKTALIALAEAAHKKNIVFIDCQLHTDHLEKMGGEYISLEDYLQLLKNNI